MDDPWKVLGIAPTSDVRSIKKAYTARVKHTHPEDDPEGFQELRLAYEMALAFARWSLEHGPDSPPTSAEVVLPGVTITMPSASAPARPLSDAGRPGIGQSERRGKRPRPRTRSRPTPAPEALELDPPSDGRTPDLGVHDAERILEPAAQLLDMVDHLRRQGGAWRSEAAWRGLLQNEALWDIDTRNFFQARLFEYLTRRPPDPGREVWRLLESEYRWTEQSLVLYRWFPSEDVDRVMARIYNALAKPVEPPELVLLPDAASSRDGSEPRAGGLPGWAVGIIIVLGIQFAGRFVRDELNPRTRPPQASQTRRITPATAPRTRDFVDRLGKDAPALPAAPDRHGAWAESIRQKGLAALRQGDHTRAAELLSAAADSGEGLRDVFLQLGQARAQAGQNAEALEAFSRQIEIDPSSQWAYSWRAYVLERLKRWDEAEKDLLKQTEVGAGSAWPYERLGARRMTQKRFGEAEAFYARATALEPGKTEHWLGMACARLLDGRPGDARPAIDRARAAASSEWQMIAVGAAYEYAGEAVLGRELAIRALPSISGRLAALTPESYSEDDLYWSDQLARAWQLLGAAALAAREDDRAEAYLSAAWTIGQLPRALWLLGDLREKQGRHPEAVSLWQIASIMPNADTSLPPDHETRLDGAREGSSDARGNRGASSPPMQALDRVLIPLANQADLVAPLLLLVGPDGVVEGARSMSRQDAAEFDQQFSSLGSIRIPFSAPDDRAVKLVLQAALNCSVSRKCWLALVPPGRRGFRDAFEASSKRDHSERWEAERKAKPSESHPLAGFWKAEGCQQEFGLAVGPMGKGTYYVVFCGPGGCFAPGEYRPATSIVDDPDYRVIDTNTIEVKGAQGFTRYVRCSGRESPPERIAVEGQLGSRASTPE